MYALHLNKNEKKITVQLVWHSMHLKNVTLAAKFMIISTHDL